MDTLGGIDKVKVCTGYEYRGQVYDNYPASLPMLAEMKPIYQEFEGWPEDISGVRRFEDLPKAAQDYVLFIEKELGCPIPYVSVGAERDAMIIRG